MLSGMIGPGGVVEDIPEAGYLNKFPSDAAGSARMRVGGEDKFRKDASS